MKRSPRGLDLDVFCILSEMSEIDRMMACERILRTIQSFTFKSNYLASFHIQDAVLLIKGDNDDRKPKEAISRAGH